jgi:Flavin-binding monooxygenase-like
MPVAEAQAEWVARYLSGEYALPERSAVHADIERERARLPERFVSSPRHTMEIDFDGYLHELRKELRRGRRRASRRGFALNIQPKARTVALTKRA